MSLAVRLFIVVAIVPMPLHGQRGEPDTLTSFERIILGEIDRHPVLQIPDLYKFVFQAAMGNEHLMSDTSAMYQFLRMELGSIRPDSTQPMIEVLVPDSSLVRLNLRPFKARQGDAGLLLHAMVATAHDFKPSPARLRQWWAELEGLAQAHRIPFRSVNLRSFFQEMSSEGFPAVHHSKPYAEAYQPAYRVVIRRHIPLFGR